MKKTLTLASVLLSTGMTYSLYAGNKSEPIYSHGYIRCGMAQREDYLRSQDPEYDLKKEQMEKMIQEGIAKMDLSKLKGQQPYATYTIPIVIHVVYNTSAQNVSDAKINAMVTQLNQDWSRTNSDAGNTPAPFQSVAADMQIQFCLATKTPTGAATNGIVRKQTSTTSFSTNGGIQSSSSGGDDPWDVNKYLNIWSGNFGGGLLGYGMFPPISSQYGTAIHYCTVGSLTSPGTCGAFAYGRTLSHEIGHCFSLYHIWGDDGGACSGSDQVSDTPNQADATSGCYTFPHTDGCTTSGNGIMYMNIMDYSDDQCYNMFTTGQKNRCQSAIASNLMSIANNAAVVCAAGTGINDLLQEDNVTLFPNPTTGELFLGIDNPNINSADVSVFNALGEAVLEKKISVASGKNNRLDMNDKPEGMYLVRLKTNEGTVTRKVVINR